MLKTQLLTQADAFTDLGPEWQKLAKHDPRASVFQTYEWNRHWYKHLGRSRPLRLLTVRYGNDLIGLLPLVQAFGPWRPLRFMATGPSDILAPLTLQGYEDVARAGFRDWMEDQSCLFDLHQLRPEIPMYETAGIEQATCLQLDLPDTYDAYLQTLSKSLRYDCRRWEKKPFSDDGYKIERTSAENLDRNLTALFDTHHARWKKRGLPGAFFGRIQTFHRAWGIDAVKNDWLRLYVLRKEDEAIGAVYAMRYGPRTFFYQAGFSPEHKSVSPGTVLVSYAIKEAIEDGSEVFDFLRGDEPYKRRWKPQREVHNRRYLLATGGMLSQSGEKWNRAAWSVEQKLRARLEGKGLIGS